MAAVAADAAAADAERVVSTKQFMPTVCPGHNRPVVEVQYSPVTPDGTFLITGCLDSKPMLRDGVTGDWIGTFEGHKGAVWSAKLNQSATQAATASGDFSAKLWDAIGGDELATFKHRHIVKSVDFSRDSSKLFTGARDKLMRVFDLSAPEADPVTLSHEKGVCKVVATPDPNIILSGCEDGVVRSWDLRSGAPVQEIMVGQIEDMELSADDEIVTVAAGNKVHFFRFSAGQGSVMEPLKEFEHKFPVEAAALHPNRSCFIVGGTDLWVYTYDFESLELLDCKKGHHGPVHCLRFSPEGNSFSSGADDATLRLWSRDSGDAEEKVPSTAEATTSDDAGTNEAK